LPDPGHVVERPSAQEAPREEERVEDVEEVEDIEKEVEEEGVAAESEVEPSTPKAKSAMRVRTISACGQKGAARIRRGPGTGTASA